MNYLLFDYKCTLEISVEIAVSHLSESNHEAIIKTKHSVRMLYLHL